MNHVVVIGPKNGPKTVLAWTKNEAENPSFTGNMYLLIINYLDAHYTVNSWATIGR